MSESLVIVGQGMAGTKLAEELVARALGRYAIILVGEEPHRGYNRVLLSSLLAKEVKADDIELKPPGWWAKNGITNVYGRAVTGIDRERKVVTLGESEIAYSKLVLATGSHAIKLPKPGMDLPGAITFRWMGDVDHMLNSVAPGRPAVVIGGGTARIGGSLRPRQSGGKGDAPAYRRPPDGAPARRAGGQHVARGDPVERLRGDPARRHRARAGHPQSRGRRARRRPRDRGGPCGLRRRRAAQRRISARRPGSIPKRGILVDDQMRTSDPDIFAIGECCEHRGNTYGLVEPAYEQARGPGRHAVGRSQGRLHRLGDRDQPQGLGRVAVLRRRHHG